VITPFAKGRRSKVINSKGLTSNASGRYQQMLKDWPYCRTLLTLSDFSPISQDLLALQHIRECRALPDVHAGRVGTAIEKCRNIWVSLPGAGYGLCEYRLDDLIQQYRLAGEHCHDGITESVPAQTQHTLRHPFPVLVDQ